MHACMQVEVKRGRDLSESDEFLLTRTNKPLWPEIEIYIQGVNSATKFKQTLIAHEAEKEKTEYTTMLDSVYIKIMNKVGNAIYLRSNLSFSYGVRLDAGPLTQAATSAAFQAAKRGLQQRGWSPVLEQEWVVENDVHLFVSKISADIP